MSSKKRKFDSLLEVDEPCTSLLTFMRTFITERDARFLPRDPAGEILIEYQSEFPLKIQEEIQNASHEEEEPGFVAGRVVSALMRLLNCTQKPGVLWGGLDSEIDTEEQVEVALRLFPVVLDSKGKGYINGWQEKKLPLFWISTCSKSLPFAPLLVEMIFELGNGTCGKWSQVYSFLMDAPANTDDEYDKKFDEVSLSIVKRLKDRGFAQRGSVEIYDLCTTALKLRPSRIEKTLKFLLDWDPTVLKGRKVDNRNVHLEGRGFRSKLPLLCQTRCTSFSVGEEEALKRFRMLFEHGMVHYPEDMGFLFHKKSCFEEIQGRSIFEWSSKSFGKELVSEIVEEVLLRITRGNSKTLQTLMISIAGRDDMVMDAWYFLCRLNPSFLMPSAPPPRTKNTL